MTRSIMHPLCLKKNTRALPFVLCLATIKSIEFSGVKICKLIDCIVLREFSGVISID
jgi:hypothetical protein